MYIMHARLQERLKEAVARRATRLELVKERAALFAGVEHECVCACTCVCVCVLVYVCVCV